MTRRSTIVAAFAAVWMGALLIRDAAGEFTVASVFIAFVFVVALFELGRAVRRRRGARAGLHS